MCYGMARLFLSRCPSPRGPLSKSRSGDLRGFNNSTETLSVCFLSPRHAPGSVRAGGGRRHGAPDATAAAIHAAGLGIWVVHMGG